MGIETDFTTQLLYAAIKTGVAINIGDMSMNVLCDLIEYSAKVDSQALSKASGKSATKMPAMNISQMTAKGVTRG